MIIGTPDHWHMPIFLAAVDAGKHIYQEKPMSKSIEQGDKMLAAAKSKPQLTIQIGTQRQRRQLRKGKSAIDEGKIGEIKFARAYDCRNWVLNGDPVPAGTIHSMRARSIGKRSRIRRITRLSSTSIAISRGDGWDYANGLVTDVGVHVVDIVHYLTGSTVPKSVVCNGGVNGSGVGNAGHRECGVGLRHAQRGVYLELRQRPDRRRPDLVRNEGHVEVVGHNIKVYEGDPGKVIAEFPSELKPLSSPGELDRLHPQRQETERTGRAGRVVAAAAAPGEHGVPQGNEDHLGCRCA